MRIPKKFVIVAVLVGLYFVLRFFGITEYLTFEQLKAHRLVLKQFVEQQYLLAVLSYLTFYTLAIALSFPSASLITISGGFLFGPIFGTVFSVVGATFGALIAFLLVRYLFAESMQNRYVNQMKRFNTAIKEDGISFLLFVRLVAIFPFFLINILVALTPVPLSMFAWTTLIGIIPGTFVYSLAGTQLQTISSARDILSPSLFLVFLLLGLLALVPVFLKRMRSS